MSGGDESEVDEPVPPSPLQVARRALVLATVSCRGILELDSERDAAAQFWARASAWWDGLGLDAELEPHEAALLRAPFGSPPQQARIDASWRAEALGVLAWALGRAELSPHDQEVDAAAVAGTLGFLEPSTVLEAARLRSEAELAAYGNVAFTVHWRLREFSLRPGSLDFATFCEKAWFGPLSLEGVQLVDGDLGVKGAPIARAAPAEVRTVMSIAQERHQAANWLLDASSPLSETDTGT
jgi:hypothetical protein